MRESRYSLRLRNVDTGQWSVFEADDRNVVHIPAGRWESERPILPKFGVQIVGAATPTPSEEPTR